MLTGAADMCLGTGVASACDLNPSKVVVDGGTEMHRAVRLPWLKKPFLVSCKKDPEHFFDGVQGVRVVNAVYGCTSAEM